MYETYLQNEREFDNKFDIGGFSNILERASPAEFKSFNRLSLIKVMKALEKELEGEKLEIYQTIFNKRGHHTNGAHRRIRYNKGIQLSLDKIREFIKLLEKEV